jgi:hypothetical protein
MIEGGLKIGVIENIECFDSELDRELVRNALYVRVLEQ